MKKIKVLKVVFVFVVLSMFLLITPSIKAALKLPTGELLRFQGKTITSTTTITELIEMFGEPTETTECAFGGEAYSFHDDTNLWYLHVETDKSGTIRGYGVIGDDFTAKYYKSGEEDPYSYYVMQGACMSSYESNYKIYGAYEYSGLSNTIVKKYWETYQSDPSKYLYALQKHSVQAAKVFATRAGMEFTQTYLPEDIFYMNEQLKYNNSSLYNYSWDNGKTNEIYILSSGPLQYFEQLPNPCEMGQSTEFYQKGESFKYVLYDIDIFTDIKDTYFTDMSGTNRAMFINPDFLIERSIVELTETEKNKLAKAKEYYKEYSDTVDAFNAKNASMFTIEPNLTKGSLAAGQVDPLIKQGATAYLNMIRAGAGIGPVVLDEEMSDAAQHKAALVMYLNSRGYSAGHYPPKTDDVSDDFYNKAQSYMSGENLYMGHSQSSIANALNDGYGDPIDCGHRYNLLDPNWSKWGVGHVGAGISYNMQAAHKFSGYQENTEEVVAWPSNGITPYEIAQSPGLGNWSVIVYTGEIDERTCDKIRIKNLSTNMEYVIEEGNLKSGQKFEYCGGSQYTFYDPNVSYGAGDVLEITLENVTDKKTNQKTNYSYRTVMYDFYGSKGDNEKDIKLSTSNISVAVGGYNRVYATAMPLDAKDKLMKFESLDESIATVRQDGTITGVTPGETIVLVTYGDVQKAVAVTVEAYQKGDVNKDGVVNVEDAAMVLDIYKGTVELDGERLYLGDMDNSGTLDVQDAGKILDKFKGLI